MLESRAARKGIVIWRRRALIVGLWCRCATCRRRVNQHTLRYWHSDDEGPLVLCYPCFYARWEALASLPPERDAYMREILAREAQGPRVF